MKRVTFALILALCAIAVYAQDSYNKGEPIGNKRKAPEYIGDFSVGGEMKTGIVWSRYEDQINEMIEKTETGSKDDAGNGSGRFRLNVGYFHQDLNVGFKFRLNWEEWVSGAERVPSWSYAFGYAEFLDNQVIMSLGRLGASPWGTGGPEMWRELESNMNIAGIRFEFVPNAVPGLNVGFVLNGFNGTGECWGAKPVPLYEYLAESVIGASYKNDWFLARTAIRLDSQCDGKNRDYDGLNGVDLIYRLEEYALQKLVPNLRFWAMGYIYGIGASELNQEFLDIRNWLFVEYAPELFAAQVRFGLDVTNDMRKLYIKPNFYFTPWDKLFKIGASFEYTKYFFLISNSYKDTPYHIIELKPLIQYNMNPNAYLAIEYSYVQEYQSYYGTEYEKQGLEPFIQKQYINIRVGVSF